MLVVAVTATVILMAAAVQSASSKPFIHKFGELREYHKHWLGVCPPLKSAPECRAVTGTSGGFFAADRLSIHVDRQAHKKIRIVFLHDGKLDREQPVSIAFGSTSFADLTFGTTIDTYQDRHGNRIINEFEIIDPDVVKTLLPKMFAGNSMHVEWPGKQGRSRVTYSLIGFSAAIKFARENANFQGR